MSVNNMWWALDEQPSMPGQKVARRDGPTWAPGRNENRLLTWCGCGAQVWAVALACVAAVACAGIALVGTGSTASELLQRRAVDYQQGLQQQPNYQVPPHPPAPPPPPLVAGASLARRSSACHCPAAGVPRRRPCVIDAVCCRRPSP